MVSGAQWISTIPYRGQPPAKVISHCALSARMVFFDAWSTPVGIELLTYTKELTTCPGTQAGVHCIENMDGQSLNLAGLRFRVQHRIRSIQFELETYKLYRNVLGDEEVREAITEGAFIMCSGRWCWPGMTAEALADALVCPNRNTCGNVIHARLAWTNAWDRTNTGWWMCPGCNPNA